MKNFKLYLLFILCFYFKTGLSTNKTIGKPSFKCSSKIKGTNETIDSLVVFFTSPYMFDGLDKKVFSFKKNKRDEFDFFLPQIPSAAKIRIIGYVNGKAEFGNDYYIEPTDDIEFKLTKDGQNYFGIFTGKGSDKYNLTKDIEVPLDELTKEYGAFIKNINLRNPDSLNKKLLKYNLYWDHLIKNLDKQIKDANISISIMTLLSADYNSYKSSWGYYLQTLYYTYKNDALASSLIKNHYNKYKHLYSTETDEIAGLSYRYIRNHASNHKIDLLFNSTNGLIDLKTYYNELKNHHKGLIREKLILNFFNDPLTFKDIVYNKDIYDSLLVDANKCIISDSGGIISNQLKFIKGSPFFNSDFIDLNGKKINTSILKGKVFLIDMWGTGCTGCATFHSMFEQEIWPQLKNNPSFQLLSINVDKNKTRWLASLDSEKYSSKEYLNVYNGEGIGLYNHPFSKYYNITGSPFLLLVDGKGKIYTQVNVGLNPNQLLRFINEALKESTL